MGLLSEFKEFAVKGNAMDMAVGIIIGAAFNKIVSSLVNDVIMPPIGMLLGGVDFKNLQVTLKEASASATGEVIPAVAMRYGMFINTVIDFLIVVFAIFLVVKGMNALKRKKEEAPPRRLRSRDSPRTNRPFDRHSSTFRSQSLRAGPHPERRRDPQTGSARAVGDDPIAGACR